ncbi:MAG TPA: hypothetical protein VM557_13330 [Thermoanaerobaculia bacterium]|nr:hypothetical protein [Thermoanaerobaculia bacterium]
MTIERRDLRTPRAYGSDRVQHDPGEGIVLDSRHTKGWQGRVMASRGNRAHPGTAIEWDEELWEVVSVEPLQPVGVRYRLERWDDSQVIRVRDDYNASSEDLRAKGRLQHRNRERTRRLWTGFSLFTGHMPASVQERMHLEYGTPPALPTLISLVPVAALGLISLIIFIPTFLGAAKTSFPDWLMFVGIFLFLETALRFAYVLSTGKPIGSLIGAIAAALIYRQQKKAPKLALAAVDDPHQNRRDKIEMFAPLLAFLEVEEQKRLHRVYHFDYVAWGRRTAWILLALIGLAVITQLSSIGDPDFGPGRWAALVVNLGLIAEQVGRLIRLSRGEPAPSVLRILVWWASRGL